MLASAELRVRAHSSSMHRRGGDVHGFNVRTWGVGSLLVAERARRHCARNVCMDERQVGSRWRSERMGAMKMPSLSRMEGMVASTSQGSSRPFVPVIWSITCMHVATSSTILRSLATQEASYREEEPQAIASSTLHAFAITHALLILDREWPEGAHHGAVASVCQSGPPHEQLVRHRAQRPRIQSLLHLDGRPAPSVFFRVSGVGDFLSTQQRRVCFISQEYGVGNLTGWFGKHAPLLGLRTAG